MTSEVRHNILDRASLTDESQTFKKAHQTVGRPPVTDRDIHEQYMEDPPHNTDYQPNMDGKPPGPKEGALEEAQSSEDGVLGYQPIGKQLRQDALGDMVTESSIHPGNPSS